MNSRVLYLGAALVLTVVAVALLFAATTVAAAPAVDTAQPVREDASAILARRVISIPFGIDTPLAIAQEGNAILVSGHGTCPEGGESFRLRTTVEQNGTRAMGRTEGACAGGELVTWEALAIAPPPEQFVPGQAQACGMVQVFFPRAGTIVHNWCVDVNLQ